jgi:HK97 family phage portal protein
MANGHESRGARGISLAAILRRWLGIEHRAAGFSSSAYINEMLGGQPTKAGMGVNPTTALAMPTVYACIRVLSEAVASLPLVLYEKQGRSRVPAVDHPLYRLLHDQPNPDQSSFIWRELVMAHLVGWGNHYSLINRTTRNRVAELIPVHPQQINPVIRNGRKLYEFTPASGAQTILTPDQVLHVQGISYDGVSGWSPIRLHRESIGWGLATQEFSAQFFGTGAQPRGVLSHPGTVADPEKLRQQWDAAYSGENRQRVAVLSQGMEYKQISVSPDDAQFVQTRALQVSEICRIFKVPPTLVQDFSRATWSNAEHSDLAFVKHTLVPWLARIEACLNATLIDESQQGRLFFKFKVQGLLRGDNAGRAAFYTAGITSGWLTRNEARELEDMDPLEGLDEPLMPVAVAQAPEEPKEEKPKDVAGDEPKDDESDQARSIALGAAGRVLTGEAKRLRSLRTSHTDDQAAITAAETYYQTDYRDHLRNALGVSAERAAEIAQARWRDLMSGDPLETTLSRWAATGPAELLRICRC